MSEENALEMYNRLYKKTIHELRCIGRALKLKSSVYRKQELILRILFVCAEMIPCKCIELNIEKISEIRKTL